MKPYYQDEAVQIFHADCREILPQLGPVEVVFADPEYGVNKAAWDTAFHLDWLDPASRVAKIAMAITPGISNLLLLPEAIGSLRYKWTLSVHIENALVRGAVGFGNWIACVVYSVNGESIYTCNQDCTRIAISGAMPDHPSPKPLRAMSWIVKRLPEGTILDPFMGSGTTLVAARDLGRRAIGIEIEERYCAIAVERLKQRPLSFTRPLDGPKINASQEGLFDAEGRSMAQKAERGSENNYSQATHGRDETEDFGGKQGSRSKC